jgi:uncharacterized iron-regulated protein
MNAWQANWSRRAWLAGVTTSALAGCALQPATGDRIVDVAAGRDITRGELLAQVREADFVLLGEQHDNPHHHARRGALIAELGAAAVVVAEQLDRGRRVGPGPDALARLQAAGFEPRAWQWPLHRALFEPLLAAGLPVLGGNAPIADVRQVARQGLAAAPAEWQELLASAPLDAAAEAALDRALVDGHCGQLPPARVPAMRAAQRVRDAALAQALAASAGRPAVLVAGNGHVRLDHGVPVLLRRLQPAARIVVVGFGEPDWPLADAPYGHLWLTPAIERGDPCAGLRMPARPETPAAPAPRRP